MLTADDGAVCLDGSPGAYYFAPAVNPTHNTSWQLYFQGGGWCYSLKDCWGRSNTTLGSSTQWVDSVQIGGILSPDCEVNPDFCNFNRVFFQYCDGNSFAGDLENPVEVDGRQLWFRGHRILRAALDSLVQNHGFGNAQTVMVTGCSAGGLSAYIHSPYVHSYVASFGQLQKFGVMPVSGFFLSHPNIEGEAVFETQIRNIFLLSNATRGVNQACIAERSPETQWQCNFAQASYNHTPTAVFPIESAMDSWQTACILTSELQDGFPDTDTIDNGVCGAVDEGSWIPCILDVEKCDASQTQVMNQYIDDFMQDIRGASQAWGKVGNGAFVHSCHTHCAPFLDGWTTIQVQDLTMQQAAGAWWRSDFSDAAAEHTYLPCHYHTDRTPRACNPTCPSSAAGNPPDPPGNDRMWGLIGGAIMVITFGGAFGLVRCWSRRRAKPEGGDDVELVS